MVGCHFVQGANSARQMPFFRSGIRRVSVFASHDPYSSCRCRNQTTKKQLRRVEADDLCTFAKPIVDEGQEMSDEMLQELRFLRNQAMDALSVFSLILTGQPELRRRQRLKKYEAIAQRLDMVCHLTGLTQDETTAYIRQQMQQTGATLPVFSDQAIRAIYRSSRGLPRLVNHLCIQALYAAAPQKSEVANGVLHLCRYIWLEFSGKPQVLGSVAKRMVFQVSLKNG